METNLRILILEDCIDDVELIQHQLKKSDFSFSCRVVETREDYEKSLAEYKPDVILSDHSLPMFDSMLALQMFHSYKKIFHPAAVFILVTGTVSEEFAVQIMRNGADDYILKDRLKRLPAAVLNAWEKNRSKYQQLKVQEEKLYLFDILQKSLHEIYLIHPENFQILYANEEALKNLGYNLEELQSMTPGNIMDSFNEESFRHVVQLAQERNKGLLLERKAVRKDGSTYPIQVHLEVIGKGRKKRILANVLDITEAKELEAQNRLAEFIQDSFRYERGLEKSLKVVLQELCKFCSWIASEIYAKEFDQLKFLGSYNPFLSHDRSILGYDISSKVYQTKLLQKISIPAKDEIVKNEEWLETGKIRTVVAIPIELGGEIIAVVVGYLKKDKTGQKRFSVLSDDVRKTLGENIKRKKTEEELQKIFDFSPDVLMVLGKDGYVRKVNPTLHKILGYSSEEFLSTPFESFLHPEDLPLVEEWRNKPLKKDDVAHYESRWKTKNGDYKWFSWSVTPYLRGELHFAVGRDITESKQQMDAIKDQNNKLAQIAWEQSHVVRAPLSRLLACVEYLEENGSAHDNILSSVKSSAYEIDKIIRNIIFKSEKVELNGKS
ncbi:PAS domain S-box protein [Salinimicrobium catena]|uniref:PAS domain S-box protein n=1 Tax=Salinimicrobium catena TaxID=390640 RepID=UPI002FE4ABC7